jgi:hypothetical protein
MHNKRKQKHQERQPEQQRQLRRLRNPGFEEALNDPGRKKQSQPQKPILPPKNEQKAEQQKGQPGGDDLSLDYAHARSGLTQSSATGVNRR